MEINKIYSGFKLVKIVEVNDIGSTLYEFNHIKSGGTLVYLENEDTNKCFSAGFTTLPEDSTGVCHIIEHSLLCGSEKYPLKEPFVNLLKGSMATFLNAMTGRDFTVYPVASQNDKDFNNLMSCYLDAVFAPLSINDPKPFLQEGWHLEMKSKDDMPSYKGVVYNEMKGAMSSVNEQLMETVYEAMYKDTGYGVNSGGDPSVIPTLTYEYYKDFYKKHYHPENGLLYLYGKMDILEKLKFIDEEYLSKYEKGNNRISIEVPQALINEDVRKLYAISDQEEIKDNTYMALAYSLGEYKDSLDIVGLDILNSTLMSTNDSPLKKMLMDASLGQDVSSMMDDSSILPCYVVSLEKTNPNEKERFKKVFLDSCKKIVQEGLDKELILATINNLEFMLKENDMGSLPKGMSYAFSLMRSFNYNLPLENELFYSKNFHYYRENIDKGYFESLIEKYILNSTHFVEVVLEPSKTLAQEKEEAMNLKMKELKESLSSKEIEFLVKQTNDLIEYQSKKDTIEDLEKLPSLSLDDISCDVNTLTLNEKKYDDYTILEHDFNTNKISYLKMYFDGNYLSIDDIKYLKVINSLLFKVNTASLSVMDIQRYKKLYLGSFSFSLLLTGKGKDEVCIKENCCVSALDINVDKISYLLKEVMYKSIFDEEKVKIVLLQMKNALRNELIEQGTQYAMIGANASSTKFSNLLLKINGLSFYHFLNDALNDISHTILRINEVYNKIFNKKDMICSLSGEKDAIDNMHHILDNIKLDTNCLREKINIDYNDRKNCALIIPSEVNYDAKGINLYDMGKKPLGSINVLTHILNYDYLWSEIRVKGGAYGCQVSYSPLRGTLTLGTYRDPNVKRSYDVFDGIPSYLENFNCSEKEYMTYLIGAIGNFDKPESNNLRISSCDLQYINGITDEERRMIKMQMKNTTIEDIKGYKEVFSYLKDHGTIYSVGNEKTLKEYGKFDEYYIL